MADLHKKLHEAFPDARISSGSSEAGDIHEIETPDGSVTLEIKGAEYDIRGKVDLLIGDKNVPETLREILALHHAGEDVDSSVLIAPVGAHDDGKNMTTASAVAHEGDEVMLNLVTRLQNGLPSATITSEFSEGKEIINISTPKGDVQVELREDGGHSIRGSTDQLSQIIDDKNLSATINIAVGLHLVEADLQVKRSAEDDHDPIGKINGK